MKYIYQELLELEEGGIICEQCAKFEICQPIHKELCFGFEPIVEVKTLVNEILGKADVC